MNPIVLITGASRGIGAACAALFAQHGWRVVIHYHKKEEAARAQAQKCGAALVVQADISQSAEVERAFSQIEAQLGTIDVLVNNAGIAAQGLLTDVTDADWNTMIGTNLSGAFYCCRRALPAMIAKKRGKIINISSIWGMVGASCEVAYSAAKAGLIGMTRALAKEVAPSCIQVNCVAPGVVDTDMMTDFSMEDRRALADETPLGRLGTPEDIARAVWFLASPDADFMTGQVLSPNGGFVIG